MRKQAQGGAVKCLMFQKKQTVTELALKPGFAQGFLNGLPAGGCREKLDIELQHGANSDS